MPESKPISQVVCPLSETGYCIVDTSGTGRCGSPRRQGFREKSGRICSLAEKHAFNVMKTIAEPGQTVTVKKVDDMTVGAYIGKTLKVRIRRGRTDII